MQTSTGIFRNSHRHFTAASGKSRQRPASRRVISPGIASMCPETERSFTIGTFTMPLFYPSILFQERMLGFTLGGLVGMGVFMYEQREVWKSTAGLAETLSGGILPPPRDPPSPPPLLGREVRDDLAHVWNSTIDKTFGSLIHSLSSKGW